MKRAALLRMSALVALGTGIVLATGGAASADTQDEFTPDWQWYVVDDYGNVPDASEYYTSFLGTGLETYGWNYDAFDNTFFQGHAVVLTDIWSQDIFMDTEISRSVVGGVITIVASGTIAATAGDITATMTTTIQGAYVRYALAASGDADELDDSTFSVGWRNDNFGSDFDSEYLAVGVNNFVVTDTGFGDPVIAAWTDGTSTYVGGSDVVDFEANALNLTVIYALQAFDPCSFDAAVTAQLGRVGTLNATFGAVIAPLYSTTCASVIGTVPQLPVGTPVDIFLDVTSDAVIPWYFDDPEGLRVHAPGAPAGLQFAFVDQAGTTKLHIFGTPTSAGSISQIVVYYYDVEDDENDLPLLVPLVVTAVLPATGPDDTSTLAANAVGLIALGVALLVVRRRINA